MSVMWCLNISTFSQNIKYFFQRRTSFNFPSFGSRWLPYRQHQCDRGGNVPKPKNDRNKMASFAVSKMGNDDEEDELEALRLAALSTLKAKTVTLPPQQRPLPPIRGFRGGRRGGGRDMHFFQRHQMNSNLISIVPVGAEEPPTHQRGVRPPFNRNNFGRKPPVIAADIPRLILPQDRYCKSSNSAAVVVQKSEPKVTTKFNRYDKSDSESSSGEESEDEEADATSVTSALEDHDILDVGDDNSLHDLMSQLDEEIKQIESPEKTVVAGDKLAESSSLVKSPARLETTKNSPASFKDILSKAAPSTNQSPARTVAMPAVETTAKSPLRPRSRSPPVRTRSPIRLKSPVRSKSPVRLRSPVRCKSPVRLRSPVRSRSPVRLRSPVRSRSPVRLRSPVRSRSPLRLRSRSPPRLRSRSPPRLRSPVRLRSPRRSRSPLRLRSPVRSRSPVRLRSRSPIRMRSRSPLRMRSRSRSPIRPRRSNSPTHYASRAPRRRDSRSPPRYVKRESLSPRRRRLSVSPPRTRRPLSPPYLAGFQRSQSPGRRRSPLVTRRNPSPPPRRRSTTPPRWNPSPPRRAKSPWSPPPRAGLRRSPKTAYRRSPLPRLPAAGPNRGSPRNTYRGRSPPAERVAAVKQLDVAVRDRSVSLSLSPPPAESSVKSPLRFVRGGKGGAGEDGSQRSRGGKSNVDEDSQRSKGGNNADEDSQRSKASKSGADEDSQRSRGSKSNTAEEDNGVDVKKSKSKKKSRKEKKAKRKSKENKVAEQATTITTTAESLVLEARRRKFESAGPIVTSNKRIRLRAGGDEKESETVARENDTETDVTEKDTVRQEEDSEVDEVINEWSEEEEEDNSDDGSRFKSGKDSTIDRLRVNISNVRSKRGYATHDEGYVSSRTTSLTVKENELEPLIAGDIRPLFTKQQVSDLRDKVRRPNQDKEPKQADEEAESDLRTELSRRRAERLNKNGVMVTDPGSRLVQSAIMDLVGKKHRVRTDRQNMKKKAGSIVDGSEGRRVIVVKSKPSTEDSPPKVFAMRKPTLLSVIHKLQFQYRVFNKCDAEKGPVRLRLGRQPQTTDEHAPRKQRKVKLKRNVAPAAAQV